MGEVFFAFVLTGIAAFPPLSPSTKGSHVQTVGRSPTDPCGSGPVYHAGQRGVRQPRPLAKLAPKYPDAAGHVVQAGAFIFEAVIDRTGAVCDVRLVRSSVKFTPPLPEYGEALRLAIKRSRYKPATKEAQPVKFRMTITSLVHVQ
jgi:TonB family protein